MSATKEEGFDYTDPYKSFKNNKFYERRINEAEMLNFGNRRFNRRGTLRNEAETVPSGMNRGIQQKQLPRSMQKELQELEINESIQRYLIDQTNSVRQQNAESEKDPIENCKCGKLQGKKKNSTDVGKKRNRISGGKEAVPHEFPWIVRITGGCAGIIIVNNGRNIPV